MSDDDKLQREALAQIKAVYDDGEATLPSGVTYVINKLNHIKRRTVFAFQSRIAGDLQRGDFWWLTSPEWAQVEKIINDCITIEGSLLSKLPNHWDEHPEDYLIFVPTMLGAISYPFMRGASGN